MNSIEKKKDMKENMKEKNQEGRCSFGKGIDMRSFLLARKQKGHMQRHWATTAQRLATKKAPRHKARRS